MNASRQRLALRHEGKHSVVTGVSNLNTGDTTITHTSAEGFSTDRQVSALILMAWGRVGSLIAPPRSSLVSSTRRFARV
ncbi:MAG: hypothetical protein RLZZ377_295 [Chloroflexota bacterium]|jgi:hypothetical protein